MGDKNVFNTTGSMLWKRIVLLFQAELQEQYALMRQDRFTVDNIMKYIYEEQISQIPATYYNKDMQTKYLNYGSSYLYALHGSGEKHIKRWIRERIMYCDTLLNYNVSSADYITLRSSKLGYVYLDIQTYIPMYVSVKWRDEVNNTGLQTKRVGKGETVRFEYNMPTATDQEILVYAGYYLKSLGDVSNLQPTSMLIANASRLTEIECHSPNLINTDLSECTKLQKIDLSDCTALGTGIGAQPILNIQNCNYLRYCNCLNTKLTAIYTKQAGGNLEEIYYPSTTQVIQLTNQTHLKIVGIPRDDNAPKSLAQVEITNCNNIEYLQYPYTQGEDIVFDSFKYVQTLTINNSLDKLKRISFTGFSKLKNVNLSTLPNLEKLGFEDMLPSSDVSTLENITISNCPAISTLSFNVSSDKYKVAFVNGGKMDIGGMYSLTKIESNTDIIGLNTLIIPTSLKELKFTNEYGEGINDLKSIWSASANHTSDGFVGIDFKDINLTYINMASLKIERGINFHITPTIQHPHLNTYRDGKTVPYFRPEGTMDLTNYTGEMGSMYKGIDFTKLTVTTPPNANEFIYDISHLFEGAIFNKNLVDVVVEINKYPTHNGNWSCMFKDTVSDLESTDVVIPTDKPMILTSMYENTDVSKDIDLPSNVTNVDYMFKDCKSIDSYKDNWLKTYDNEISHMDAYKNTANDRIVPIEWGGKGYIPGYVSEIVIEIPTDNYEFILTTEPNYHIIGSKVIDWGDGVEEILVDSYSHVYERKGKYTILGSFVLGNTKAPSESIQECLTEVYMMADSVSDLTRAFQGCNNLKVLDFDTSHVTSMSYMFLYCSGLTELDVSNFDTTNVTTMYAMFNGCKSLTSLNVSNFNTSNVTTMESMFEDCKALTELDLSNFNTSKVTNMYQTFCNCLNLTSLNLPNFNTENVTTMQGIFTHCSSLTELDLSSWNTKKVNRMSSMFYNCKNLSELDLSNFDTSNVTNMEYMFTICSSLKTLTCNNMTHSNPKLFTDAINNGIITELIAKNWVINSDSLQDLFLNNATIQKIDLSNWSNANVTTMLNMFNGCSSLTELDLSNFDTSNVTNMQEMFESCSKLTSLDLSNFNTSNVTNMQKMFYNCSGLTELDLSNFDTSNVTTMYAMFYGCSNLTSLDLSNFNTENVTDMIAIFYNCSGLTELNLSNFNTSNVTDMKSMFNGCSGLTELNLSNFNTSNVTDISYVFQNCSKLTSLDLSSFNTKNVTNMGYMFNRCLNLKSLNLSSFNTKNVISMQYTFYNCSSLTELDVSNFNTENVTTMQGMFQNCSSLTELDVSNFDTKNVTTMYAMFYNCSSLTSLDLSNFDTTNVTDIGYMFQNCSSLNELKIYKSSTPTVEAIISLLPTRENSKAVGNAEINITIPNGWKYKYIVLNTIVQYTCTASGVRPTFNSSFKDYNVTEKDNNDGTWTTIITRNSTNPTSLSFSGKSALIDIYEIDTTGITTMANMFYNCSNLVSIDFSSVNTKDVTTMQSMFQGCSKLTELNVSNFDTSKVTTMQGMFLKCSSLTELDLSSFNTSNVTTFVNMFQDCSSLISLDISNFNTENVTTMQGMFYNCKSLKSLDLSNFDTTNVTAMNTMFYSCSSLTSLDLSNFNTSRAQTMAGMFNNCNKMLSLNISSFDLANVTSLSNMFAACSSMEDIEPPKYIYISINLSPMTKLSRLELLQWINALVEKKATNETLTLGSTLKAKLTNEDLAIATNKGWTIA